MCINSNQNTETMQLANKEIVNHSITVVDEIPKLL